MKWSAVKQVTQWQEYGLIFIAKGVFYAIPRRAFENDVAFEQFMDIAKELHEAAQENEMYAT